MGSMDVNILGYSDLETRSLVPWPGKSADSRPIPYRFSDFPPPKTDRILRNVIS